MDHYTYHTRLKEIWKKGYDDYQAGGRTPGAYLTNEDQEFLAEIGATQHDVYDFTDDFICFGAPDWETFWSVQSIRFNYFKQVMKGQPGTYIRPMAEYTPKDGEIKGISWLPRIIEKAQHKLRGELDPDIMYGCGGDRKFLKNHNLHPAEFLQLVWNHFEDPQAIAQYLKDSSPILQKV
ncbi:MAG: hypothetical protein CMI18_00170 [Opitutaceae bacterium]|nr:hypothetical protein [Opitutaceae bacterium]|tara:strand:- start:6190 stop:6726 length:537 start_codon:yes stop_codon:yes gene_type:complete